MGGHGGLNILPQKKWNVYRRDNRERVIRDKDEASRRDLAEKKAKAEINLKKTFSLIDHSDDRAETESGVTSSTPINLFEEEERAIQKVYEENDKYLKSVGHDFKEKSPFCAAKEEPWWTKPSLSLYDDSRDENYRKEKRGGDSKFSERDRSERYANETSSKKIVKPSNAKPIVLSVDDYE
eukprot:GDKJ01021301.1.p1 GENE.GDKJ01021301.1~~GDKJ01021301.1.p1  ORF type:complete len:181 (+),score=45.83 GDKJ01021301.1:19-561(+)